MVGAVAWCTGAATSARSGGRRSARHSCSSPTTMAGRPPAFAWRTGTATADQTLSPAASSDPRRAAPAPGTRRCGSTFAAVAENADFAGPNQALHLTGAASLVSGTVEVAGAAPAGELGRSAREAQAKPLSEVSA